jgi:hypothetical protein
MLLILETSLVSQGHRLLAVGTMVDACARAALLLEEKGVRAHKKYKLDFRVR